MHGHRNSPCVGASSGLEGEAGEMRTSCGAGGVSWQHHTKGRGLGISWKSWGRNIVNQDHLPHKLSKMQEEKENAGTEVHVAMSSGNCSATEPQEMIYPLTGVKAAASMSRHELAAPGS